MLISKTNFYTLSVLMVIIVFLEVFSLIPFVATGPVTPLTFGLGIMLFGFFLYNFLFKKDAYLCKLDYAVLFFFLCLFISAIMAYYYWDQSFYRSLIGYRFHYIFFLYFALVYLEFSADGIEKIIKILFFLSLLIFLIDSITFPYPLFSSRFEERRGGITIFFSGQGFTFLGGFYYLEKFFKEKKYIYLLYFGLAAFCLFGLTQSRMQLIAVAAGGGFLLYKSHWKNRYAILLLLLISAFSLYSYTKVFNVVKEANRNEVEFYNENIRVQAAKFFLTKFQKGTGTILFGNGLPGKDTVLLNDYENAKLLGYYTSDVGLIGIFSYFGIFGVIIWLLFFKYAFSVRDGNRRNYVKSYFITILTTAATGYSLFDPGYLPSTVVGLYLVRCSMISSQEN